MNAQGTGQLANVLSIIEAVAVVISLVTIVVQLRQNTHVLISSSYQNLTATFNAFLMGVLHPNV